MKVFNYSIICEDIAHSTFINELLSKSPFPDAGRKFELNIDCFGKWKFNNKADILKNYIEISARSFKLYGINLLFVIADFDDWDIENFPSYYDDLYYNLQND